MEPPLSPPHRVPASERRRAGRSVALALLFVRAVQRSSTEIRRVRVLVDAGRKPYAGTSTASDPSTDRTRAVSRRRRGGGGVCGARRHDLVAVRPLAAAAVGRTGCPA